MSASPSGGAAVTTPDDWRPSATPGVLALRAQLLRAARGAMEQRNILEVETPLLGEATVTDPAIHSLAVTGGSAPRYLQTSPEFYLKRLLAAGMPDIYQLGRVFRGGEHGRRHHSEFTMLEWYRRSTGPLDAFIAETLQVIAEIAAAVNAPLEPPRVMEYRALFREHAGLDPLTADANALAARAGELFGDSVARLRGLQDLGRDDWLDLLFAEAVLPQLPGGRCVAVRDYPASQAALARLNPHGHRDGPATARRFEVMLNGLEIANGYHELADADEQRARFARDCAARRKRGLAEVTPDEKLLAALAAGLPDCYGVAAGLDRLLMALTGSQDIAAVTAFVPPR